MAEYAIPTEEALRAMIGTANRESWRALTETIDRLYDMDRLWNSGGKRWAHEFKYRRGGKTLCALYARQNEAGLMIIFGGQEREAFEKARSAFSAATQNCYDEATTYRDGKWVMFPIGDPSLLADCAGLLAIKRKPNRSGAR